MTSYHGWTHMSKAEGGTDPIPGAAGFVWARRYNWDEADQSIPDGVETMVLLDSFATSDAATFAVYDSGDEHGIEVLADGLYALLVRLWWDEWPGDHVCNIYMIDDPDFASGSYALPMVAAGSQTINLSGSLIVRLQAGQTPHPSVYHNFGSARELEGFGGTFLELVRLGSIDLGTRSFGSP